ncbi:unnamed protein product [marine sediment metagenome]|uniref:Uncharacterized protein n=1 Tax=marine sediment metagenome TaxID=412755 RepID=X1LJC0_9ZZZZ
MTEKPKKKKIKVSIDIDLIERLTRNGTSIQDKIRYGLKELEEGKRELNWKQSIRVSIKQIEQILELCSRQGLKMEIPFPSIRPLMLVDYQHGKQPKILRFPNLNDVYEYLENAWREAIMAKEQLQNTRSDD